MAHTKPACTVPGEIRTSDNSAHERVIPHDPILSDEARGVLEIIFNVALNSSISALGSVLNIINIIIFSKQGFSDSVNVSLCALAVSDICSLLPMVWIGICSNPLVQYSDISFDTVEIHYLTGGLPHSCFVRTTGLITAFITFERCVCVALPLKVNTIITPKRTLISVVAMFIVVFAVTSPLYFSINLGHSFYPKRNKTLIGLVYTTSARAFENFSFSFNVYIQLSSFIIVIVCTVILVLKLLAKSERRHKTSSVSTVSDSTSIRDKRVMKMVTLISFIFIICYCPSCVNLILMVCFPSQYSTFGQYLNSYLASWAIISTIEAINSSVTILVYYNVSSKFRASFTELFSPTTD